MDVFLARATGLEPATYCVTGNRSNQLSYARKHSEFSVSTLILFCNTISYRIFY